jgi:predicted transcriptional regulator
MSDKKKVLEKLLTDHIGQKNAISHADLSEALALSKSSVADLVQEIRDDTDAPALGTNKGGNSGTYVIADKEELQEQISVWNREKQRITERIENTLESFDDGFEPSGDQSTEIVEETYACQRKGCENDVPKDKARWPKSGPCEDQVVCKSCYGQLVIEGQA